MKARTRRVGAIGGAPPDLLVCFPTRAHLTLMPKAVSSPSRTDHHPKRKPMFKTNKTQKKEDIASEPTSPKVTCAGQIKIKNKNKNKKSSPPECKNWIESLGLKKDVMNFMGALRGLRFNMQCFGMFHPPVICSSDDEDEEEEEEKEASESQCKTIFSKWFMVLEENEGKDNLDLDKEQENQEEEEEEEEEEVELPPKNALLLIRCRSAPMKRGEEEEKGETNEVMQMGYSPDCFKLSTDIAKETWLVGSVNPMLSRSKSCRR